MNVNLSLILRSTCCMWILDDLVSMVTDLKVEGKNEDALSIADSGVGTSSIITAATEVSRCYGYTSEYIARLKHSAT